MLKKPGSLEPGFFFFLRFLFFVERDYIGSVVILGGLTFVNFSLCIHLC